MKTTLSSIASIRTGLFARPEESGDVVYLQSKHFDENGKLKHGLHGDLKSENLSKRHFLKAGEILFAAKGTKNFASVYEEHNPKAVASTSFFVISVKEEKILPEFLAWFINQPEMKLYLRNSSQSTSMPSISKSTLEALEIPVPSIQVQKSILELTNLRQAELNLKTRIEALRQMQIQHQITELLK